MNLLTWLGILICLSQSAILSGMNLGLYSLSKLELNVAARKGDQNASRVLKYRRDSNFTLVTILWANVSVNVLLAMLSESALSGILAFLFSTLIITVFAEIIPQAYFSRHALRLAAFLLPVLRFYQILLYPLARPSAMILEAWLGGEEMRFFQERDLRRVIQLHMDASTSEIDRVEGQGALNFLDLDDVPLSEEGQLIDPTSILSLKFDGPLPEFPPIRPTRDDSLLQAINTSGKSWVVITDLIGEPRLVLSADDFIREAIFDPDNFNPHRHCHRPIISSESETKLGVLIQRYQVRSGEIGDDIIDDDVILLWGKQRRVITGTDILGRLLRGIAFPPNSGTTLMNLDNNQEPGHSVLNQSNQ
jgi:metal transporter CNNM